MMYDMQLKRQSRDMVDSRRLLEYCQPQTALENSRDRTYCAKIVSHSYLACGFSNRPDRDGIRWTQVCTNW